MNPFRQHLDECLDSVADNMGLLFQVKSLLDERIKSIKENFKERTLKHPILATALIMGDLTGHLDNGWKINFPTLHGTELHAHEIDDRYEFIISREGLVSIANSFEVLETLMFNLTARFLTVSKREISGLTLTDNFESNCQEVRKLRGRNNKELLKAIRKLSSHFGQSEKVNNRGLDLRDWYNVLCEVRHSVIHTKSIIKKDRLKFFDKPRMAILDKIFPNTKSEGQIILTITHGQADEANRLIAEYAFLIFKCYSIELGYDWKTFPNMDGVKGLYP